MPNRRKKSGSQLPFWASPEEGDATSRAGEPTFTAGPRGGKSPASAPLADRMRPARLEEVVGQEHLTGEAGPLAAFLQSGQLPSIILWGPPGSGKTTLARILGEHAGRAWETFSAVTAGVKEVRAAIERAAFRREAHGQSTLLFVDEIHRFNRAQQDAFLHAIEDGTITLLGATTENPSFHVNSALLSRCRVYVLRALDDAALRTMGQRALTLLAAESKTPAPELELDAWDVLLRHAQGDARRLIGAVEVLVSALQAGPSVRTGGESDPSADVAPDRAGAAAEHADVAPDRAGAAAEHADVVPDRAGAAAEHADVVPDRAGAAAAPDSESRRKPLRAPVIAAAEVERILLQRSPARRGDEDHFDWISAFQKSIRGSDPHAAVYWLARMLEAGEDPLYIVRRLVRMATEDVGLAEPGALAMANAAREAVQFLGEPECHLALAQCAIYLALAPKSNSVGNALVEATRIAQTTGPLPVPLSLRNAPTRLMESMGYGEGYRYAHDYPGHWVPGSYLPEELGGQSIYRPSDQGREARMVADHGARTQNYYRLRDPDFIDDEEK
jgi:putative ATPase